MCGIVAYLGRQSASELLLSGLRRLEYRGYDSSGIAMAVDGEFDVRKAVGRVDRLAERLADNPIDGTVGLAHTRWATHGRPTEANAHPHLDQSGQIALVHNGVIENHAALRSFLGREGVVCRSETDSEVLAQLIGFLYGQNGDLLESVHEALRQVEGTFGLALLCADDPSLLIAARRGSPLIVGIGDGDYVVASDASAIVSHTTRVTYLEDNEVVLLGPDGLRATTIDAAPVEKIISDLDLTLDEIELGRFEHHMLKEIFEQPDSLRDCTRGRVQVRDIELTLGGLASHEREIARTRRVLLFGCGTAWHAGLVARYIFEELTGLPTQVEYASELRYRNPIIEDGTLAIAISQSGETADTLAALREVRTRGALGLGVVNAVGSTIARESDAGVYLHVGSEIGVASTKAFTAQVAVLTMIAAWLGRRRQLSQQRLHELLQELERIPEKIDAALALDNQVRCLAGRSADFDNWLYLGRGVNFPIALEGALKLKEVSYVHAEGLPAAEMKHGPIAMIDAEMPVVAIAPRDHTYEKVLSNIEEVRSRDGRVIAVATEGDTEAASLAEEVLYVPPTLPLLSPLLTNIPLQLLAYYVAIEKGLDVDKPRNLAKSVTVE